MKAGTQKTNWLVDAVLFTAFLISFFLELTGVTLHQWLGAFIGGFCGYHLLVHWSWVKAVTRRYFGRTSGQARLFYLLDAGLLLGLTTIIASGLLISTWLNLTFANYAAWKNLHVWVSLITLALLVIKIALHWRWIVMTSKRAIFNPPAISMIGARRVQPVVVSATPGRRDFLKLMGIVGAAALLAASSALNDDGIAAEDASPLTQVPIDNTTTSNSTSSGLVAQNNLETSEIQDNVSTACTQRCNRGCSYPGHCRRYIDSNGNNLCDLGECI